MKTKELPSVYQAYIHKSRYARYLPDVGRRETWEESVDRYFSFMKEQEAKFTRKSKLTEDVRQAILNLEVMPKIGRAHV